MMSRGMFSGLLIAAAAFVLSGDLAVAKDREKIWSGIVFASNRPSEPLPPPLDVMAPKLRRLFGYRHFRLLSQNTEVVKPGMESWLIPSKEFYLKVANLKPTEKGYRMRLILFQHERELLDAEVRLKRKSPLVIRGPAWGDGTVIIVLACKY